MRYALMVEPQQGITGHATRRHRRSAPRQAGFGALYRSDHYDSFPGPLGRTDVDAFATIAGLVRETARCATARWSRR